jgi:hypothetical protein
MIRKSVLILLTIACIFLFAECGDSEKINGSENKKTEETGLSAADPGDFGQLLCQKTFWSRITM